MILIGALLAASAHHVFLTASQAPSGRECIAGDRLPILGCIPGEAARQRAEGRWHIDPGIIIWADPDPAA
jgi:hypothetical protein